MVEKAPMVLVLVVPMRVELVVLVVLKMMVPVVTVVKTAETGVMVVAHVMASPSSHSL